MGREASLGDPNDAAGALGEGGCIVEVLASKLVRRASISILSSCSTAERSVWLVVVCELCPSSRLSILGMRKSELLFS